MLLAAAYFCNGCLFAGGRRWTPGRGRPYWSDWRLWAEHLGRQGRKRRKSAVTGQNEVRLSPFFDHVLEKKKCFSFQTNKYVLRCEKGVTTVIVVHRTFSRHLHTIALTLIFTIGRERLYFFSQQMLRTHPTHLYSGNFGNLPTQIPTNKSIHIHGSTAVAQTLLTAPPHPPPSSLPPFSFVLCPPCPLSLVQKKEATLTSCCA